MATANLPAPLYPLLQARDGFGPLMVAVVFAAYAGGVIASLVLVGGVSDRLGRRRVLVPGLLLCAAGTGLSLISDGPAALIAGRVLIGLAAGVVTAAATASLFDLHERARPGAPRGRAELVATAANLGGLGGGPLVSGLLATYTDAPLVVPFAVFSLLALLAAAGLATVPETVTVTASARRLVRPIRVRAAGPGVGAAWLALFAAYAVQGFFSSLAPGLLADTLGRPSPALAGAVACLLYVTAAVAQLVFGARPRRRLLGLGVFFMPAGLVVVTVGMSQALLPLVLVGGALAGTGIGMLTRGCIATVTEAAPPAVRGEALAGLFLAGYLGLCLPVLGLGLATEVVPDTAALAGFTAIVLTAIATAGRLLLRPAGRRAPAMQP